MQNKQRRRRKAGIDIGEQLDIPNLARRDVPHIEAEGNREIIVDGCKGILEYAEDRIKINTGSLIICFKGTELIVKSYSEVSIVLTGNIISVEFST